MNLAKGIAVHFGDCLAVLPSLPENSIDSCVTDPPYHLINILRRFGGANAKPVKEQFGTFKRHSAGFMGKQWDGGDIAFRPDVWLEVYRVLKPGAHLLAFGGTRTYHRMACAIEDAGFEIRDCIQWLYGSGFPKSHDVSKGIDRASGAEREITRVATRDGNAERRGDGDQGSTYGDVWGGFTTISTPATDAARQWQGWGTALKPACEPIVLARKPLSEKTVAANVLKWGTGAINVDGCRVGTENTQRMTGASPFWNNNNMGNILGGSDSGRWPANIIHDGSAEVMAGFPETADSSNHIRHNGDFKSPAKGFDKAHETTGPQDEGSAARFFYTAKADSDDRLGSRHPTVKPVDLIQYLVRLVTPKGGTVLDPFAGTGTTGEAACYEACHAILIEREAEYLTDMQRRMRLVYAGPDERRFQSAKARADGKPIDAGPLFGGSE